MKFFTRAWHTGGMTDAEFEAAPGAYEAHLAALDLPPSVLALARADLHDGRIVAVDVDPAVARLALTIRSGDRQVGYADVVLGFVRASIDDSSHGVLERARGAAGVALLSHEVDRAGVGFECRLLFYPSGEATIRFGDVVVTRTPVVGR